MRHYWSNPSDAKRYGNDDFNPAGSKRAVYILVALLLALVLGSLFIGSPASDRGDAARSPDQTMRAPPR